MTREEILKDYTVKSGIIRSPGKFEGEPLYAPYFWDLVLEGTGEVYSVTPFEECDESWRVEIDDEDRREFPELLQTAKYIRLWVDDNGFVYTKLMKGDL